MNNRTLFLRVALLIAVTFACLSARVLAQPKVSADEQKAYDTFTTAPDPVKAAAAADFVKKYPKSSLRPVMARQIVDRIQEVKDGEQKIALAKEFKSTFNNPAEEEMIMPVLLVGYSDAKKPDEAFTTGASFLGSHPDSVGVLVELLTMATEQAKQKNGKFVLQGEQYGTHAVELIEANKKPASMSDETWKEYKDLLPRLYQSLGILGMVKQDRAATQTRLIKATELDPKDPFNYLLLSGSLNDEYQEAAKKFQAMKDGPEKTAALEKVLATMDRVIDAQAHFIALSEGVPSLAGMRQQELQDLESYYKYRHNGKADGMQQLIDKYKTPAKPKDPFSIP